MQVVLYEPEIPPNTGNIARLCAAFNVSLHLIEPLGFEITNKHLKRAGLDYWNHVKLNTWPNWQTFMDAKSKDSRLIMATTKATESLQYFNFEQNDMLIFGPETRGLPEHILSQSPHHLKIPIRAMQNGGVRSLNLSTACGIFLYAGMAHCHLLDAL